MFCVLFIVYEYEKYSIAIDFFGIVPPFLLTVLRVYEYEKNSNVGIVLPSTRARYYHHLK